jgi:hypothetical protein
MDLLLYQPDISAGDRAPRYISDSMRISPDVDAPDQDGAPPDLAR